MRGAALVAWWLAACAPEGAEPARELPAGEVSTVDPFELASETWEVPSDLLRAVAVAETGMQMVVGIEGHDERPAAYGMMALRGDRLTLAAELAGLDEEAVRFERDANVLAAAALLSTWADEAGIDRSELAQWAPVVARFSGIEDEEAQRQYIWQGVYRNLRFGFPLEGRPIKAYGTLPEFPEPISRSFAGPNYAGSVWRPSPNYDSRNAGAGGVGMVVIHTCEGTYSGCWGWLTNSASGVSAHYVVNESGSEVSQLVNESSRAWHVGATYDCGLNGSTDCSRSGWNVNHFTVGIEHGGYASQSTWSDGLLTASSQLTCDITRDHNIPRDSYHIVAHGRLQPYNRTDPGPNWPWTDYINRVRTHCGDGGTTPPTPAPSGQFVIDSNNGFNQTADYTVEVSANWTSSTNVSGYYQTGYWVAATQAVSDPANFKFRATGDVCYQVEGWWTSAADRSTTAPFIGYNAAGTEVGRATVNQQGGHGQWNNLGTWGFSSGWNKVSVSRWTTAGFYVVADAVRLTPSSACTGCQFQDPDADGTNNCTDTCPSDTSKTAPGACGCGVADTDGDGDGRANCLDQCPSDAGKTAPGTCGCGVADTDIDGDGQPNCLDQCPSDAGKTAPGTCGCGVADTDTDGDGAADCQDSCPTDAGKVAPGACGCGLADVDLTGDGQPDCVTCGDGVAEAPEQCDDGGTTGGDGCSATCQLETLTQVAPTPGTAGVVNTFAVNGATPGATVTFIGATRGGLTLVPGCPGASVPFAGATTLGTAVADASGRATLLLRIPGTMARRTARVAAWEGSTCRVSDVWFETF